MANGKGLIKPPSTDDEDQVARTPRARRTVAAKQKSVNSDITYDSNGNPTALSSRDATADDLEQTDMPTIRRMTPGKGMPKP